MESICRLLLMRLVRNPRFSTARRALGRIWSITRGRTFAMTAASPGSTGGRVHRGAAPACVAHHACVALGDHEEVATVVRGQAEIDQLHRDCDLAFRKSIHVAYECLDRSAIRARQGPEHRGSAHGCAARTT